MERLIQKGLRAKLITQSVLTGQMMIEGIPVLSPTCLIPFKAKAWQDLKERKLNGDQVDSKNIKKHKNDVFRLALLITANGLHTQRKKY